MAQTAFALAGLGGFNAHGAGFLDAATRHGMNPAAGGARPPALVTATSGQIVMLRHWLKGCEDLRGKIVDPRRERNPLSLLKTAMFGLPGVFEPAYREAIRRWWTPPTQGQSLLDAVVDRALPAQQYVPDREDSFYEDIAATFRGAPIGVVFNAYDPIQGRAVLYGNAAARDWWPEESSLPAEADAFPCMPQARDVRYAPRSREPALHEISVEGVKAALWLTLYGFQKTPCDQLDGAYHRACLVSELHAFDRIIVARPLANGWVSKDLPTNYFEAQDWQTEMWFSVGYKAEVDALRRINQLIDRGHIRSDKFKKVALYEVQPRTPAGYFNFFIERDQVYDDAFAQADALFSCLEEHDAQPGG